MSSSDLSKSSDIHIAQPATDNSLDAFLNSTLHVNTQPAPKTIAGYPSALDPFLISQKSPAADPFSDWPEF